MVRLGGDTFAWVGNLNISPRQGAILPGAGDGITQLGYAVRNDVTYLIADSNDDGRLGGSDFVVQFNGTHNFTVDDFDNTDFVIAGTNGDDTITGTEGDDRIFGAGGNDTIFALGGSDEVHGGTGHDSIDGGIGQFDFDQLFGADTLFSGVSDDQIAAGVDPVTFELDGDQDLIVYTGTGRWSEEGSFFGDTVEQFEVSSICGGAASPSTT